MDAIVLGDHGMPQTAQSVFRKYDTNGDGVLQPDELQRLLELSGFNFTNSQMHYLMEINVREC